MNVPPVGPKTTISGGMDRISTIQSMLVGCVGIDRARSLLNNFHQTAAGLSNVQYDSVPRDSVITKAYFNPAQKVVPLVLGTVEDLSFYDVQGKVQNGEGGRVETMAYLDRYLLIPTKGPLVGVMDDHNHSAFFWRLAKEAGIIRENGAVIHDDEHEDSMHPAMKMDRAKINDLKAVAEHVWRHLLITEFQAFAMTEAGGSVIRSTHLLGKAQDVYFVDPGYEGELQLMDYTHHAPSRLKGTFNYYRVALKDVPALIRKMKAEGQSVTYDFDLDRFMVHYSSRGRTELVAGRNLQETMQLAIDGAKEADFVTVATSPNWFLTPTDEVIGQTWEGKPRYREVPITRDELKYLIKTFIDGLNA